MNDSNKQIMKIIVLDIILAVTTIVLYSPGLISLRATDESILRAGLSIILIPVLLFLFWVVNSPLLHHKSVKSVDGHKVMVNFSDSGIIDEVDKLNSKIRDSNVLNSSYTCRACLEDIFVRAADDNSDLTVPIVRSRLDYYLEVYRDTLERMVILEKYSRTSLYEKSYKEISSTLELLQEVFLNALDQILSNTLNGAELDKIVLSNMMAMDGFGHNPFEAIKDKYK